MQYTLPQILPRRDTARVHYAAASIAGHGVPSRVTYPSRQATTVPASPYA
jgi:hypothetical protein